MYYTEQFYWGVRLQNGEGTWFKLLDDFFFCQVKAVILFILINVGLDLFYAFWNSWNFVSENWFGLVPINEFATIL